jgi:hypothetical protein
LTTHEAFVEHIEVRTSSDRAFGLTVGGILAAIGLFRALFGSGLDWLAGLLLVVGLALVVMGFVAAERLAPLNRAWTRLGLFLFKVVNPVIMLLIYIVGVVPVGLVMRAIKHDPLHRRREPEATSYWIERQPPGPAPETIENQF